MTSMLDQSGFEGGQDPDMLSAHAMNVREIRHFCLVDGMVVRKKRWKSSDVRRDQAMQQGSDPDTI